MRRGLKLVPLVALSTAVVEVVVFVLLGRWIGFGWTVLLLLAASMLGLALLRREGMRAWRGFRAAVDAGRPPGEEATNGLVGLAGALLLALPWLTTGVVGLLLLVPPLRRLVRGRIQALTERRVSAAVAGDLFGPRRVRVRRGQPQQTPQPAVYEPPVGGSPGEAIEGEIVEPRRP
ncbi:FxsA family protein [Micromonospora sonneratiae]|uniref:FxsA family protein n=1 Tax=Micromonospora sonneratiae TaxID=1184706 RepID=A0ABW3YRH0_9ACTN